MKLAQGMQWPQTDTLPDMAKHTAQWISQIGSPPLSDYVVAPVIMLGLICWSRIFLKRHTSTQVLAGCVIGGLVWIWVGP